MSSWREEARCKETDPNLFFPIGTTEPALLQIEAAKVICRQCNVRQECLDCALGLEDGRVTEYGIWGGLTEEERRYMRRELVARRAKQAAPEPDKPNPQPVTHASGVTATRELAEAQH